MKIGMLLDHDFPPDHRVEKEALSLVQSGHDVIIFCFNYKSDQILTEDYKGIQLYKIPVKEKHIKKLRALVNTVFNYYPSFLAKHLTKFIEKFDVEVLHLHDLYTFLTGIKVKEKFPNLILVGDLHENYVAGLSQYRFSTTFPGNILISLSKWTIKEKEWIGCMDYNITVVQNMKRRIYDFVSNPDNIIVVDNSVEVDEFLDFELDNQILESYPDKFVISYIGGMDYHRGIQDLIGAMEYLKDIDNLVISIVGSKKNSDIIDEKIKKLKIEDKVKFEGFQQIGKLQNFFKRADIGVIPHVKSVQTDNSSPNKLYQYMLMETPVISSNCDSIVDVINETECGLIYESGNAEELAKQIRTLYNDKDLMMKFSKNGKAGVLSKYNFNYSRKQLVNLYDRIEKTI